jgi:hypothetical protein
MIGVALVVMGLVTMGAATRRWVFVVGAVIFAAGMGAGAIQSRHS